MNCRSHVLCHLSVAALVAFTASAFAQSGSSARLHCQTVGSNYPEPLGDREGHSVAVSQFTCRTEGGLLDGGVLTGLTIWEYDKTNAVALSGNGITRKPGAVAAYEQTEGKVALTLVDGKATGFTGSGRGRYTMATGAASGLSGKTYTFTFKTTGPFQFVVDYKID